MRPQFRFPKLDGRITPEGGLRFNPFFGEAVAELLLCGTNKLGSQQNIAFIDILAV